MKPLELSLCFCLACTISGQGATLPVLETGSLRPMPEAWVDQDTGHRVARLIPGNGENRSFYFHNNPFVPATKGLNDKMIFYRTVDGENQLFSIDLATREIEQITHTNDVKGELVGPKTRRVFYQCGSNVYATGIEDHQTRLVYAFPDSLPGRITTLNADESLLCGAISSPEERELFRQYPEKRDYFNRVFEARLPRTLFTIHVDTGKFSELYTENAWLNHIQFSPTDPNLLMFCHEGPWHKVDRIWTIDITGGKPRLMHRRTMDMEIAGHEFFSRDGRKIWYDLQLPRGETFYLSAADVASGEHTRYALTRDQWSIHFNLSPDQTLFAGDGGDPGQVAKAQDGMWIYLFRPDGDRLASERLVNLKHHDYRLEPNVHFSPDAQSIIFRANFEGHSDIYAVDVRKHGM